MTRGCDCPDPVVFGPCRCAEKARPPAAAAWKGCACDPCMAVRAREAAQGVRGPARQQFGRRLARDPAAPWWVIPLVMNGLAPHAPVQDAGALPAPYGSNGGILVHYIDPDGYPGSLVMDDPPRKDAPVASSVRGNYTSPFRLALTAGLAGRETVPSPGDQGHGHGL